MSELLRVETELFELVVWCNDISRRQQTYHTTLAKRAAVTQLTQGSPSVVRFAPALPEASVISMGEAISMAAPVAQLELKLPLFFENLQYQFEWVFFTEVDQVRLTHRRHLVNEAFRFARGRGSKAGVTLSRLTGSINTGNDVGWMRLPLEYVMAGQVHRSQLSFEVLPTKMDLHSDLPAMYQTIDQELPLWRFSLMAATDQDAAKGQQRGNFPLLWLANFRSLREQFEQGLKVITQAPHSRLQTYVSYSKADSLKGRLPHSLAEKVKEDLDSKQRDKRYRIEKKRLSVDTPENRFIKMVVSHSQKTLSEIERKLRLDNQVTDKSKDKPRLSAAFLDELHEWQKPLQKTLNQSFLKEVGVYKELSRASLVLQQKTGYSSVYRVWQELKFYLDVFANQSSVSMKSVADIYEVWCFLTLKNILLELGFTEQAPNKQSITIKKFLEYQLPNGLEEAFEFTRNDGVTAKLAHEPQFSKTSKDISSYLVNQRPDIVLEVSFPEPSEQRFIWLFDAKYRINSDNESTDYVPDDAINQMHRYRDALIRVAKKDTLFTGSKSRPVFGAFALYPGFFNQLSINNPYSHAINEIGIGAFALLPSSTEQGVPSNNGHYWLQEFLREQIGEVSAPSSVSEVQEQLYVQEAARIPYHGMRQVLYQNLTMTAALGLELEHSPDYFNRFKQGTAKYYHMPTNTFALKFKAHVATELQFLALSFMHNETDQEYSISRIWPIKSVNILPRNEITEDQSGKISNSTKQYFLFELGKALTLTQAISDAKSSSFRSSMKLTTLARLSDANTFDGIEEVYRNALVTLNVKKIVYKIRLKKSVYKIKFNKFKL